MWKKLLVIILVIGAFYLYNKGEEKQRKEFMETQTTRDLLNDLYFASDTNIESLSRILDETPNTIDLVRKGEAEPSSIFESKIKKVSLYYIENDKLFSKLQEHFDTKYNWFDSVKNFPSHHPFWFWSIIAILIILFILKFFAESMTDIIDGIFDLFE